MSINTVLTQILTSLGCGLQRYFMRRTGVWVSVGTSSSTIFSLNSCSHSGISELAGPESANNGFPRSIVVSFLFCLWVFGWLGDLARDWIHGKQRVSLFYHQQHWNLTQARESYHFHFDPLFLESHCDLMLISLVKKTSLKKMWNYVSPVLKVSLKLKDENWRKNSLTSQEPR